MHKTLLLTAYLVFGACHFPATFGACATGINAILHAAHLLAAFGAGVADIGTNPTLLLTEGRTAQQQITGGLADFGAVNHQAKMCRLNVFSASIKAMLHRCVQAGVVAFGTGSNAGLQAGVCFCGHIGMVHE